jgi:hypothetical protein
MKDFIPFELAYELKEIGFDEETFDEIRKRLKENGK